MRLLCFAHFYKFTMKSCMICFKTKISTLCRFEKMQMKEFLLKDYQSMKQDLLKIALYYSEEENLIEWHERLSLTFTLHDHIQCFKSIWKLMCLVDRQSDDRSSICVILQDLKNWTLMIDWMRNIWKNINLSIFH